MDMEYTLIRSARRTLSLSVTPDGVVVRAPMRMPKRQIDQFVLSRREWIDRARARMERRREELDKIEPLTREELEELRDRARRVLPERAAYFAPIIGVRYGRITVRTQRTRWGSCSASGNLSFNCLLMLTPPEVIDSVVVHELCHLRVMDHSPAFYEQVLRVFPDYYKWHGWLRENGQALMRRRPEE